MNINITLIIQAFSFFIAYMIMDRLLLRPVIASIDHQDELQQSIEIRIEHVSERIDQQLDEKDQHWSRCKRSLRVPDITLLTGPILLQYPEQIPYRELDPFIKHALIKELQSVVVGRVINA